MRGHTVCTPVSSSDVTPSYMKREKHFAAPCNNNSLEDEGGKGDESGRMERGREGARIGSLSHCLSFFFFFCFSLREEMKMAEAGEEFQFLPLSLSLSEE